MLETVQKKIQTMDDDSFTSHYMKYIMKVQDENLQREADFFFSRNLAAPSAMIQSIESILNREILHHDD